jgi:hypothetical protein
LAKGDGAWVGATVGAVVGANVGTGVGGAVGGVVGMGVGVVTALIGVAVTRTVDVGTAVRAGTVKVGAAVASGANCGSAGSGALVRSRNTLRPTPIVTSASKSNPLTMPPPPRRLADVRRRAAVFGTGREYRPASGAQRATNGARTD